MMYDIQSYGFLNFVHQDEVSLFQRTQQNRRLPPLA
jgi:hypothetical protein